MRRQVKAQDLSPVHQKTEFERVKNSQTQGLVAEPMDTLMLQTALLRKDQKHKWLVNKGFKNYDHGVEKVVT